MIRNRITGLARPARSLIAISLLATAAVMGNPFFAFDNGLGNGMPPAKQAALLKELGYDGIGYTGTEDFAARRKAFDDEGLRIFNLYVPCFVDKAPYQPGFMEAIRALKGTGVDLWLTVQGKAPDDTTAVRIVREIADEAAAAGVRVALYPHKDFFVETAEEALRVIRQVERPNVGVTINLCHELAAGNADRMDEIVKACAPHLFYVSINGADRSGGWRELIRPLDEGNFDVPGFLKSLGAAGYKGPVGLQCYQVPGAPEEHLQRSITKWQDIRGQLANPAAAEPADPPRQPNIIFIMADDQGYGDASCYNPESKIPTPGIDRIAKEGIRFTDAHSGAAVCTPTRYGLLTGRYNWRSRLQSGVLVTGGKEGCLIDKSILTVPEFLKQHGYQTALVGKWHLGYSYEFPEGSKGLRNVVTQKPYGKFSAKAAPVGSKIIDGPVAHGFDEFHGFHHAREMHSWAKHDKVTETIPLDQVITRSAEHSIRFIEEQSKASKPFFLYLALGSPHTPIVPSDEWVGKSGISTYADFVMETDHATVRILETLDRLGVADNTLVFFTTDNGCSPAANFDELRAKGHDPSYSLRGTKADAWDGGHRVPYVVRWPGVIQPGRVTDEIICHNNLMATCAEILGAPLPDDAGVDSFSILPVLRGAETKEPTHPFVIHHSISGRFAIRKGDWKFIACKGSGGWSKGDDGKPSQLYQMAIDRKESNNRAAEQPDIVAEMTHLLETAVTNGRTTPGPKQKNDAKVVIWKDGAKAKNNRTQQE